MNTPPPFQITIGHVTMHIEQRERWDELGMVYIGRRMNRLSLGTSLWANQFRLPDSPTRGDREECLRGYASQFHLQPLRVKSLPQLAGKTLLCWCGGSSLCHGHFLAAAVHLVPVHQPARWADACRMAVEFAIAEHRARRSGQPLPPTVEALRQYGVEQLAS